MEPHKRQREQVKAARPDALATQPPENKRERKKLVFRIVVLVLPIAVVVLLELALRLSGYGAPTAFFVKSSAGGYVTNEKFAWQFFTKRSTSKPVFSRLPDKKTPNTIRVFVVGESAAMGTPDPAFSFSRILELLLERQYPGKRIEIINAAMRGIDSYVIRKIVQDCAGHEPDLFVAYMGNNEVIGLHGPEPGSSRLSQSLLLIRLSQAIKSSRLGQLGKNIFQGFRKADAPEKQTMDYFRSKRLRTDDPLRQLVYKNFRANLEAICRAAKKAGAPVVLSTVPVNLKDFPPLGSLHRASMSAAELSEWNAAYERGNQAPRPEQAVSNYLAAVRMDDHYAELHFRLAQAFLPLGNLTNAVKHFFLARDWDALQFRADSRINQTIREVAQATGNRLIDADEYFYSETFGSTNAPKLFRDHVHPTFLADFMLAGSLFPEVVAALEKKPSRLANPLGSAECAAALGYTEWHDAQIESAMVDLTSRPPYQDQLNYQKNQPAAEAAAKQRLARLGQTEMQRALNTCGEALRRRPNDWMLHYNYASICQAVSQFPAAVEHVQFVVKLFPEVASFRVNLAQALARAGRPDAAIYELEQARRIDSADPRIAEMIAQLRSPRRAK